MSDPQTQPTDQSQFHDLCAGVEDYETLPELHPVPLGTPPPAEAHTDAIDEEILAHLVSP